MGTYSKIRSTFWLLTGYPAYKYSRLLSLSEYWSREQLENFRNEKLKNLISHCYESVPYYRRIMNENNISPRDVQHVEDLAKLPVLTKDIIRVHSRDLMAKNISQMTVSWSKTGGTTGEPMYVCKNEECNVWANMCHERGLRWGGLTADEPRVSLFGGSLGTDKKRVTTRIGELLRRDLFIPAFELRSDTVMPFFDIIRRFRYRFLLGYASAIYRFAVLAEEMNQKLTFDAVFPTAELLLPEWKEFTHKAFQCAVLPYYGCGEVNALGYQRLESADYYIPDEHVFIEVMDRQGQTLLFGDGGFVITDLDNYAMPLIRYVNGDAGKISVPDEHVPFSRIERLDGRYNSLLMTDTGELISGVIGTHIFRLFPSVQIYRIIQEEPLRLVIKIVPKSDFSGEDEDRLLSLFGKYLGSRMKITIERVANLPLPPSGKAVFVVNHCI